MARKSLKRSSSNHDTPAASAGGALFHALSSTFLFVPVLVLQFGDVRAAGAGEHVFVRAAQVNGKGGSRVRDLKRIGDCGVLDEDNLVVVVVGVSISQQVGAELL